MNLEAYRRSGLSRYERLAATIARLLERAIGVEGGYRLQQIQHRAKTVESLAHRLERDGQLDSEEIEAHRKDLAGCRVVFYTNNDVNRFTRSGLLHELFEVDWKRSRFHQPGPSQESAGELFQSFNYVVKLKADRTALLEYEEFEGLWCEAQVQTTLNHAWAEMAHDTIYKRPEWQGFGGRELAIVERRLEEAMRRHLLPAGYLFQRIATDAQRLADGKELFDAGALDAVLTAANNNERYDALLRLKDGVLPYYDDLEELFPEVRDKLKQAWVTAEKTAAVPHKTPFGDFPGHESHAVTGQIAEIIEQYCYLDPDETYTFLRDLYVRTAVTKSRNQLIGIAERLAAPTLQVWEHCGAAIQVMLADMLSSEDDIAPIAPLATTICSKILEPEITGTTSTSTTISLHRGAVVHDSDLAKARRTVIETIAAHAENVTEDDEALQRAASALFDSGRRPRGAESQEVAAMILSDLAYAVERMLRFAPRASLSARQDIEAQLLRYWRWNRFLTEHLASSDTVVEAHGRLVGNMTRLRESLNADEDFRVFKTIVGYKSVLPHQWDEQGPNFDTDEAVRDTAQDRLADGITAQNWPIWKSRLAAAANVKSNNLATFPPFRRFLSVIADRQPRLASELLDDRNLLPAWTIHPIAHALLEGELRADVTAMLRQWVHEGRYLQEVAGLAVAGSDVDAALISEVAKRATDDAVEAACTALVAGAARRYADNPGYWRDEIFLPCLAVLQRAGSHEWIERSWPRRGGDSIVDTLDADRMRNVLEAMVGLPRIDYEAEQILFAVAARHPDSVLNWFGQRFEIAAEQSSFDFDAMPFRFQSVHQALRRQPREVMAFLRRWHGRGDAYVRGDVSRFLSRIYPDFEEPLPGTLLDIIISTADPAELVFVASVLEGFNGRAALLPTLRAILASDAANDDVACRVSRIWLETGVMRGEFGGARTYQEKGALLTPWLDDPNRRVAEFAADEIHTLDMMVASENRRAQERIAMRRLQYGEPLDPDDAEPQDGNGLDGRPT